MVWIKSIKLVCIVKQTWMCKKYRYMYFIVMLKISIWVFHQLWHQNQGYILEYITTRVFWYNLCQKLWLGLHENEMRWTNRISNTGSISCIRTLYYQKKLLTILLNWNIQNLLLLPTLPTTPAKPSIYILGYIMKCEVSVILL